MALQSSLHCGQEGAAPEGWESLYYADKQPAPTVVARGRAPLPARLVTIVGPADSGIVIADVGQAGSEKPLRVAGIIDRALAEEIVRLSSGLIAVSSLAGRAAVLRADLHAGMFGSCFFGGETSPR